MSIIKQYSEYLRDNPQGYWFKRKLYGWGWIPARWQGWGTLGVFIIYTGVVVAWFSSMAHKGAPSNGEVSAFVIKIAVGVAALIGVCYWKGEKPKWQWDISKD